MSRYVIFIDNDLSIFFFVLGQEMPLVKMSWREQLKGTMLVYLHMVKQVNEVIRFHKTVKPVVRGHRWEKEKMAL